MTLTLTEPVVGERLLSRTPPTRTVNVAVTEPVRFVEALRDRLKSEAHLVGTGKEERTLISGGGRLVTVAP